MVLAVLAGDFIQAIALGAAQQPIQNLTANQWRQHGNVFGCVEQTCQTQDCVEHRLVYRLNIQPAPGGSRRHAQGAGIADQRGDFHRIDIQTQGQYRVFGGDFQHPATDRHRHGHHQIIERVVGKVLVRQTHLLAPLGHDAQRGFWQAGSEIAGMTVARHKQRVDTGGERTVLRGMAKNQVSQFHALFFKRGLERGSRRFQQ